MIGHFSMSGRSTDSILCIFNSCPHTIKIKLSLAINHKYSIHFIRSGGRMTLIVFSGKGEGPAPI